VEFDFVVSLSPIRVIGTFEIDFNTENQISRNEILTSVISPKRNKRIDFKLDNHLSLLVLTGTHNIKEKSINAKCWKHGCSIIATFSFVVLYIMRHLRKSLRLSSILRQFKCCNMSPITRSNFSNSFKRPQFVKLCTIIKPVTF
jgi:hypothetical protein